MEQLNPKTRYVKKKIKGLKYAPDNVRYIRAMLSIEKCMAGEIKGIFADTAREHLEVLYPEEFVAIMKELRPDLHEKEAKRHNEMLKKLKLSSEKWKKEKADERKRWKALGGKL